MHLYLYIYIDTAIHEQTHTYTYRWLPEFLISGQWPATTYNNSYTYRNNEVGYQIVFIHRERQRYIQHTHVYIYCLSFFAPLPGCQTLASGQPPRKSRRPQPAPRRPKTQAPCEGGKGLAFIRYCLHLVVCARVNRPFFFSARLHCPHCCNTIARILGNLRPPFDLPLVCHTPYQIGNNNMV